MVAFDRIALISGDRAFAAGGTQSGKSTLCAGSPEYDFTNSLCGNWIARYNNDSDNGRLLIIDSKPRFRAAFRVDGISDARRYRNWGYGPEIPGSTRVNAGDIDGSWRAMRLSPIVIIQTDRVDVEAPGVMNLVNFLGENPARKVK